MFYDLKYDSQPNAIEYAVAIECTQQYDKFEACLKDLCEVEHFYFC